MSQDVRNLVQVSDNVVIMRPEPRTGVTRREAQTIAERIARQLDLHHQLQVADEEIEEMLEAEHDYRMALDSIELIVLELLEVPLLVAEKVALIKNRLQPVLMFAGDVEPLAVFHHPLGYEESLNHILRIVRALRNYGDPEWIATGVAVIQSMLHPVLARAGE